MQEIAWLDWLLVALLCSAVAIAAVTWQTPERGRTGSWLGDQTEKLNQVLLFDGNHLIEASTSACAAFKTDEIGFDWTRLHDALSQRFPSFPENPDDVRSKKVLVIPARGSDDKGRAICEWIDGITRVVLRDGASGQVRAPAVIRENDIPYNLAKNGPNPSWQIDLDGSILWSNLAYDRLSRRMAGSKTDAPPVPFPSVTCKRQAGKMTRTSVAIPGCEKKLWYNIFVVRQDSGILCYAVDINAVVDAEQAQRNFVQTLAKTFAHLSIGLAIFDRNRQLALFNPALIDLTTLPADFLSARPNLFSFFDRLRDQRVMPEPKNYSSWRQQMADLVAAAADGRYQETWTLPSGSVYSVTGRPHPDGAVAFLIEDITAEITLTRQFRTDLEINQSMLDQMDNAIAVFSDRGGLCFANRAYRDLWGVDPESSFVPMTVLDATRTWQGLCHPTPILGEVREFVGLHENRAEWQGQMQLLTGQTIKCAVFPISHGATMVVFTRDHKGRQMGSTNMPETRVEQFDSV
ncbi:MAG: PAS-domain containing protein [Rhodobacteraceae bacterium]|nr:PAS-domain containing protein [Paracoccaceae bacterium]